MLGASGPQGGPSQTPADAPTVSSVPPRTTGSGRVGAQPDTLTGAALRARVAAIPLTKFREGYDTDQVDTFVDRVVGALDGTGPDVSAAEVLNASFSSTKFREGYDQDAVDNLLDEVVATLRAR